ncbi:hypothetical protein L0F51_00440 [Afifella sp. H1R]|uniref:hypothetical protein n=1 Tax=Afifella sp. H1R TaxID=2908841 RepID=UPI001F2A1726|nr:hypothetical protein [Afifella sp. H1R]MCF1502229.1 hypothetical protein [Afifella sp. H1R]
MNIPLPQSAFFLPPRIGENNGVDFLGLRQANLDLMAEIIPATNNVTDYVRPFSLLCWIFWKFHKLCEEEEKTEVDGRELQIFRERIEVLFTWGARLADFPRLPGKRATPPPISEKGAALTFKDWGRSQDSTSLIAALWYGPAAKMTGLRFLMPVPGKSGFFRTVEHGISLAEALDERLQEDADRYIRLLSTLKIVTATEEDAQALWDSWRPDRLTTQEADAFRLALFDARSVGSYKSMLGRRSSMLSLVQLHLQHEDGAVSADQVRSGVFLSQGAEGDPYELPEQLQEARQKWIILQMRQLQRYSLENLLGWVEMQLREGAQDTEALVSALIDEWTEMEFPGSETSTLDAALDETSEHFCSLEEFIAACRSGDIETPFALIERIYEGISDEGGGAAACLHGLFLCAEFTACFPADHQGIQTGGPQRLSLFHLHKRFRALGGMPMSEAIRFILEAMVISQHFATAVNRFDGQSQRLRLAIDENGLARLVDEPWAPSVTEDRLPTLLSLAAQAGLVGRDDEGLYLPAESGQ